MLVGRLFFTTQTALINEILKQVMDPGTYSAMLSAKSISMLCIIAGAFIEVKALIKFVFTITTLINSTLYFYVTNNYAASMYQMSSGSMRSLLLYREWLITAKLITLLISVCIKPVALCNECLLVT